MVSKMSYHITLQGFGFFWSFFWLYFRLNRSGAFSLKCISVRFRSVRFRSVCFCGDLFAGYLFVGCVLLVYLQPYACTIILKTKYLLRKRWCVVNKIKKKRIKWWRQFFFVFTPWINAANLVLLVLLTQQCFGCVIYLTNTNSNIRLCV